MVFLPIPLHDGLCWCVILQEVDPKMLTEMEKALKGNKRLKMLALSENEGVALPKEFCRSILLGTRQMSLSCFYLDINPQTWDCPDDGIG